MDLYVVAERDRGCGPFCVAAFSSFSAAVPCRDESCQAWIEHFPLPEASVVGREVYVSVYEDGSGYEEPHGVFLSREEALADGHYFQAVPFVG